MLHGNTAGKDAKPAEQLPNPTNHARNCVKHLWGMAGILRAMAADTIVDVAPEQMSKKYCGAAGNWSGRSF